LATGTIVDADGVQVVSSGGVAEATIVTGQELILSGATANGATVAAGQVEVAAGGSLVGPFAFGSDGGTLRIDGTTMPSVTLGGFAAGDLIDLANVASAAGGTALLQSGNVLVVTEAGTAYTLHLDPNTDYSGHNFVL